MAYPIPPDYVTMCEWNIIIIEYSEEIIEKFLGYDINRQSYRISSQILEYDKHTNTGRTLSSSMYEFLDKPGKLHVSAQEIYEKLQSYPKVKVSLKFLRTLES